MGYSRVFELSVVLVAFIAACVVANDLRAFDDTTLYKINWPGRSGSDLLEPDADFVSVTSANNERYKCFLPKFVEKEKDSSENYTGSSPLGLLFPLFTQSSCSYRLEPYWNYELCHGRYIRQYHEDRDGRKIKVQEYILGVLDFKLFKSLSEELDKKEKTEIPVKKIDGINMPYLQLDMVDGTVCDLNGKPRTTRVLYVCHLHGKHEIYSLKESSTCEYEVVVLSPLLCAHPKYRAQESGENIINCLPYENSPKKPRDLLNLEAESLKLRFQKAVEGGEPRVRVEFHPVEGSLKSSEEGEAVDEGTTHAKPEGVTKDSPPTSPTAPISPTSSPVADTSPAKNFLFGHNCLHGGSGWWKYEFCFGKSVVQYHEERDGKRTATVTLGLFDRERHKQWIDENPHKKYRNQGPRYRQVSHFYHAGTPCDVTGRSRHVEVKLKCPELKASGSTVESRPAAVALYLLEPKTCEYVLAVESPLVCVMLPFMDEYGLLPPDPPAEVMLGGEEDSAEESSSEHLESAKASSVSHEEASPINLKKPWIENEVDVSVAEVDDDDEDEDDEKGGD
ncbi:endoplasmic reticulum lectin 1 isoform X2 [Ischnura elegans]|uniref:endoplasmic reticulum lectin 1 isoform X2 n=1 Tax=Ischnura elegans TaxID=197161 RepID=UPI001ED89CBA|nr:endoplasmic reticulum lectin 1 isoform X2 [Ischnura elegans]